MTHTYIRRACVYSNRDNMSSVTNLDYREVVVRNPSGELMRDRYYVHFPVGELFGDVFDKYTYVYVKWDVPFGKMTYRLQRETPLKTALDKLGWHDGVVQIWADNKSLF